MAAQAGRLWALSIYNGSTYVPVAGLRTRSFKVNSELVDVTNADSTGHWREILGGGAGVFTLDIDASGVYQQDASAKLLFQAATTANLQTMRLVTQGIQIDGSFLVQDYEEGGEHNKEVTFTCKLNSSGQPTFTYS
jgi:TP901-1 family phage major tail protein